MILSIVVIQYVLPRSRQKKGLVLSFIGEMNKPWHKDKQLNKYFFHFLGSFQSYQP